MDLKRYEFEVRHIIEELENLERGIFYEEGCTRHPGTASAKTIARNLKQEFIDLMDKIANNEEGNAEVLNKAFNKTV